MGRIMDMWFYWFMEKSIWIREDGAQNWVTVYNYDIHICPVISEGLKRLVGILGFKKLIFIHMEFLLIKRGLGLCLDL